jgi:aryl-alcohol dehydrogenase-like predicted oxidoreductase
LKYQSIPGTNLSPSVICLGTAQIGSVIPEADAFRLLDTYYGLGGTFLDTAQVYADWLPGERSASEKTIGRWLKARGLRNHTVVSTKGGHPDLHAMEIPRLSPEHIVFDVERSLLNLQTDRIDLYWLHRDDPNRPVSEMLDIL